MPVELENSSAMTVSNSASGEDSVPSGDLAPPPPAAPVNTKRNLPGMPDPDAEVIALSPKTLMATNPFVCEICYKGFQREQNLQLHRRGHNLLGKLRQRTGKEVRKMVFVCPEPSCVHHDPSRGLGDLTGIKKHFCRKHGEKRWKCDKCSKKYAVQSDWKAHSKTCGSREYLCDCGTLFSRRDSFITHRAFCDALAEESAKAHTMNSAASSEEDNAKAAAATSIPLVTLVQQADTLPPKRSSLKRKLLSGIRYEQSKIRKRLQQQLQQHVQSDSKEAGDDDDDEVEAAYAQKIPSFLTHSIYGREEEKEELIKLLLRFNGTSSTDVVSIISITGVAGIGKTTLAQIVYNDGIVREHFSLRVWLSLPYQFDLIWLLQAIIWCIEEPKGIRKGMSHFKPWLSKTTTESPAMDDILLTLLHDLSEKLAGERFLLVLDDFQMEDPLLLRTLRNHRLVAKIIVTTRKERVAAILEAEEVYHLKGLQEDECWTLFREHALPTQDSVSNKQLEYIGKQIVRNCDGVPLAAKMLGCLLRDEQDEQIWINVLRNMRGSDVDADVMLQAVRVTYECMPPHLKPCLAHCCGFPRDFKFKKEGLVNMWVQGGLINYSSGSKTIEDIGMEYFDDLQRRSHLKPCLAYRSAFPRGCKLEADKLTKLWMAESSQYSGSKTLEDMGTDMWKRSYFHCNDVGIFTLLDLVHDLSEMFKGTLELPSANSQGEESTVYYREDDKKRLLELLQSDDCRTRDVSIIRIVAAAGVGKTTLIHLLYNHFTVCEIFETRAWVCANEILDVSGLTKELMESLAGISCSLSELTEIQEAVREELMGKRFLLVLDNVSNDDMNFWSSLLVPLSAGAKGSVVLATTEYETDALSMDMVNSYKLNQLSQRNCWLVFRQHVFDEKSCNINPELIEIGKQIITKCKGLTLAVKAIGGLLQSTHNERIWKAALESDLWYTDNNLPALRLSYYHLPVHLKRCFQFCSLFPKAYVFEKDHLVRLWMSQDFIEHEEGKHVQDTGIEYFNELLKRSFFQRCPTCGSAEKKYVMHDLFHDLAQSVSVNMYFRAENCKLHRIPEAVLHISLAPSGFGTALQFEQFMECTHIHTLLLLNRSILKWDASSFHVKNPEVLNDLFLHLRCLRTLDLSFTNIQVVPESIVNLQQLRYLALNKTKIRRLPESICSLNNLQTLELHGCRYLSELPACMKNLANLQHLDVWKGSGFVSMPCGIGQLTALQTLSAFMVGRDVRHCGISELKNLVNLRGSLCIGGIGNVADGNEAKEARLNMMKCLQTLVLHWRGGSLGSDQSEEIAYNVLQDLQPHSNLEHLTIHDYFGYQFPKWIADPSFPMLISLTLDNCCGCNTLPRLGQLPSLKYLSIRMMDSVKQLDNHFCGSGIYRGFPSLETLKFWEMSQLEKWSGVEDSDFPVLRSLSISRCNKLKRLPCFTSLVELSVHCCAQLPDLPTLPCLKSLKIEGFQNLESLPEQLNLPALRVLEISNCEQLISVGALGKIALKVTGCPKLCSSANEQLP